MILDGPAHLVINLVIRQIAEAMAQIEGIHDRSAQVNDVRDGRRGQSCRRNLERFDNILNHQNREAEDLVVDM